MEKLFLEPNSSGFRAGKTDLFLAVALAFFLKRFHLWDSVASGVHAPGASSPSGFVLFWPDLLTVTLSTRLFLPTFRAIIFMASSI